MGETSRPQVGGHWQAKGQGMAGTEPAPGLGRSFSVGAGSQRVGQVLLSQGLPVTPCCAL